MRPRGLVEAPTVRLVRLCAVFAALPGLYAGCSTPAPDHSIGPTPAPVRTTNARLSFARPVSRLIDDHEAGRLAILRGADARKVIVTFIVATKMLPSVPYQVGCPTQLDLTGARRGECIVRVGSNAVPYDLWIDDGAHQVRIGGHGFAIETTRIRNAVAAMIQRSLPRVDISPYDVLCGQAAVQVITPGSRVVCEYTAAGQLLLLAVQFHDLNGRLEVHFLRHR